MYATYFTDQCVTINILFYKTISTTLLAKFLVIVEVDRCPEILDYILVTFLTMM